MLEIVQSFQENFLSLYMMVIFTEGKRVFSSVPRLVGSFGKHELFSRDDLC